MKNLLMGLVAGLAVVGVPTAVQATPRYTNLYVFGDSFSDTGNAFKLTNGVLAGAPNLPGRFSNGKVWVEYLAQDLGVTLNTVDKAQPNQGINFAVGGATTGTTNLFPEVIPTLPTLPGLQQQVAQYATRLNGGRADAKALYIIWAGAADYAPFVNGIPKNTTPQVPLTNLTKAIYRLGELGARNVLVVNVPDLGKAPLGAATNGVTPSTQVSATIRSHNNALRTLGLVNIPGVKLTVLDVAATVKGFQANPQRFGLTNATEACSGTTICANPDGYLFWDAIHYTTKANRLIADKAIGVLK